MEEMLDFRVFMVLVSQNGIATAACHKSGVILDGEVPPSRTLTSWREVAEDRLANTAPCPNIRSCRCLSRSPTSPVSQLAVPSRTVVEGSKRLAAEKIYGGHYFRNRHRTLHRIRG